MIQVKILKLDDCGWQQVLYVDEQSSAFSTFGVSSSYSIKCRLVLGTYLNSSVIHEAEKSL